MNLRPVDTVIRPSTLRTADMVTFFQPSDENSCQQFVVDTDISSTAVGIAAFVSLFLIIGFAAKTPATSTRAILLLWLVLLPIFTAFSSFLTFIDATNKVPLCCCLTVCPMDVGRERGFLTVLSIYLPLSLTWGLLVSSISVLALILQKRNSKDGCISALGRVLFEVTNERYSNSSSIAPRERVLPNK
jgi:hypothetical protein